jgi:hypothetical protein
VTTVGWSLNLREVVPSPRIAQENPETSGRYGWAALLKRVFQIDFLRCPRCGSAVRTIAAITDPAPIAELLRHFGLSTDPPSSGGKSPRPAGKVPIALVFSLI